MNFLAIEDKSQLKKYIKPHKKKSVFRKYPQMEERMEDEVAMILLECSYSLLELSIRAKKRGVNRVARCVLFFVSSLGAMIWLMPVLDSFLQSGF